MGLGFRVSSPRVPCRYISEGPSIYYMGGGQNYGPFLHPYYDTAPNI